MGGKFLVKGKLDQNSSCKEFLYNFEDQARRRKQVFMQDWERKLDEFLAFNECKVLPNAGRVSQKAEEEHARQEYERFAERRLEYKEALGEGESIKALEEAAKLVGRGQKKVEGGE
jgi:hypothetical protein